MSEVIRSLAPKNNSLFGAIAQNASGSRPQTAAMAAAPSSTPATTPTGQSGFAPRVPRFPEGWYDEREYRPDRRLSVPIWRQPYNRRPYNPFTPLNGDRPPGWPRPKPLPHTTGTGVTAPPVTRQTPVTGPPTFATGGPVQQREGRWL